MEIYVGIRDSRKESQIIDLCTKLGFGFHRVTAGMADATIGEIVSGIRIYEKKQPAFFVLPDFIIFSSPEGNSLDLFLSEYRKAGIPKTDLKAVVTNHNISWTLRQLLKELKSEHEAISKNKQNT